MHGRHEQLVKPFLYHGLSIAAGDTYDRNVKLIPMSFRQSLQGSEGGRDNEEIGIRIITYAICRLNNEVSHASSVEIIYIVMAIITL